MNKLSVKLNYGDTQITIVRKNKTRHYTNDIITDVEAICKLFENRLVLSYERKEMWKGIYQAYVKDVPSVLKEAFDTDMAYLTSTDPIPYILNKDVIEFLDQKTNECPF